ncbi:hypothetical protein EBT16_02775 [bacterium]|nr:hypothetical protein [bacterium]
MKTFLEFLLKEQTGQFGYRSIEDYELCKKRGLVPNWRHNGKLLLYFSKHEDEARQYGTIIVRFPWPHDARDDPANNPFYSVTESPIPPSMIYIKPDDHYDDFVPIKDTKMERNTIFRIKSPTRKLI